MYMVMRPIRLMTMWFFMWSGSMMWRYFAQTKQPFPTLVLKTYTDPIVLTNYKLLIDAQKKRWIPCEYEIATIPDLIYTSWMDRLYLERLEYKTLRIQDLLEHHHNDWEAVLFIMLSRNFGTKINGDAFQSLAGRIPFPVVRKCLDQPFQLEALLLGLGGLLPEDSTETYVLQLQGEYEFLQHKFKLDDQGIPPIHYHKLRPSNFPTIRLSQLAATYHNHPQLFQKICEVQTLDEFYDLFNSKASPYWNTHYSFNKSHTSRTKKLSKAFIDLLMINTIIPIRFAYAKYKGVENHDFLLELMRGITAEKNSIIQKFDSLRPRAQHALDSQALIELKTNYCDHKRCLQCRIGNWLLGR